MASGVYKRIAHIHPWHVGMCVYGDGSRSYYVECNCNWSLKTESPALIEGPYDNIYGITCESHHDGIRYIMTAVQLWDKSGIDLTLKDYLKKMFSE